jgi:hypothetical protein
LKSTQLFDGVLTFFLSAKNAARNKLCTRDFSDKKSKKKNENGKESFKSPSKNRHILAVVDETEEELKYRQKYAKSKSASS